MPPRLAARIEGALGASVGAPRAQLPERCIDAGEVLLRELLARPSSGRESALDLLAVDALVTYAFEAASESPATLAERADQAMRRLAAIARE
ncbi:MAG TPA: hypothetical protein VGM50_16855 [Gemmatimonadaceae bacterium]